VAVTWIDLLSVLLIAVMGMGLWHLCESGVRDVLRGEAPDEEDIQERFQVPRLQRDLTRAEETWKAALKELLAKRQEVALQAATLAVVDKTTEEYRKALDQHTISSRLVGRLEPYVRDLEIYVGRREAALYRAKRAAAGAWEKAQADFERRRKLMTLGWAAGITAALFMLFWAPLSWECTLQPGGSFHSDRVLATAIVLLAALFSEQAFGVPGLALASAALLLVLLMALLHRPSS
jgi:hypothetical protein